jgi:hypothetical protein
VGRWQRTALAATAAALVISGCALDIHPPGATTAVPAGQLMTGTGRTGTDGTAPPAVTDNEVPTPPGPDERARVTRSAVTAVRDFALGYVNWDAADVKLRLRALAADSVGQARSAMQLAASQTGSDPELAQAGIANSGAVEAVAALAGGGDRYVVVTLESTTATDSSAYQGLAPAWHLTVATVARRGGGWVLSGWQPES